VRELYSIVAVPFLLSVCSNRMLNVQYVFLTHATKLARNSRDQWQVRLSSPRDANSVESFVASDKHNVLSESQNRLDDIRQSIFAVPTSEHSKQQQPQQFRNQGPEHQALLQQQQESDERAEQEHLKHLQIIADGRRHQREPGPASATENTAHTQQMKSETEAGTKVGRKEREWAHDEGGRVHAVMIASAENSEMQELGHGPMICVNIVSHGIHGSSSSFSIAGGGGGTEGRGHLQGSSTEYFSCKPGSPNIHGRMFGSDIERMTRTRGEEGCTKCVAGERQLEKAQSIRAGASCVPVTGSTRAYSPFSL